MYAIKEFILSVENDLGALSNGLIYNYVAECLEGPTEMAREIWSKLHFQQIN